jgi:hypothetical protein
MIKNLKHFVLAYLLFTTYSFSQNIQWEKSFGGKHDDVLMDVIPTPDYGFIMGGSSISNKNGNKSDNGKGNFDFCIWKMNENGELEWQKSFGGSADDILTSIKLTREGGYILGGTSNSNKSADKTADCLGEEDFWIIKLDPKGNIEWQKILGGENQDILSEISLTKDGGFIIGGSSESNTLVKKENDQSIIFKTDKSKGSLDYWVIKLDKNGNDVWQKSYGGKYLDKLNNVLQLKNGDFLLAGSSNSPISFDKKEVNFGMNDFWIIKINSEGLEQWQKVFGGNKDEYLSSIIELSDENIVLGGSSNSNSGSGNKKEKVNGTDFWLLKIDKDGNELFQEVYDFETNDILISINEADNKDLLLSGYFSTSNNKKSNNLEDFALLKINNSGEEVWRKTIGTKGTDILKKVIISRDKSYVLAGTSDGGNSKEKKSHIGKKDFWILKLKDNIKPEEKLPIEAYPNPTNQFTNVIIGYEYNSGNANLYDLNGRLLDSLKINGERTIPFNISRFPQGIYIIEIITEKENHSIKIIKS